jgi:hypothetical protein
MFGIDAEGNPERKKKVKELSMIKKAMDKLKDAEGKDAEGMAALAKEYYKIAAQLNWAV